MFIGEPSSENPTTNKADQALTSVVKKIFPPALLLLLLVFELIVLISTVLSGDPISWGRC